MSRIGKKPIEVPDGVTVAIDKSNIIVKGPKGETRLSIHPKIEVKRDDNRIIVERSSDHRFYRSLHGLTRNLISNMILGVTKGFEKTLDISGIGYKAMLQGRKIVLTLGYSHSVNFELPEGIEASVDPKQTQITIRGIDKYKVGQVSANIRNLKKPEPYKGKGIIYAGERIRRKAGKAGKK
jgi:large subunit ribosomal protein L6